MLFRCPALAERAEIVHGFTGRGVDLGVRGAANWAQVTDALVEGWAPERVALLEQVHGGDVVRVEASGGPQTPVAAADAAFTTVPGVVLAVRTADCVPVLLAGPGVVGVAHAGWRGAAADIAAGLVRRVHTELGVDPADITCVVGPAISGGVYEVGDEVVEGLARTLPRAAFLVDGPGRPHVDLQAAVAAQLGRAGVGRIAVIRRCTATDPALYSYRADGPPTGRQAGVIAMRP